MTSMQHTLSFSHERGLVTVDVLVRRAGRERGPVVIGSYRDACREGIAVLCAHAAVNGDESRCECTRTPNCRDLADDLTPPCEEPGPQPKNGPSTSSVNDVAPHKRKRNRLGRACLPIAIRRTRSARQRYSVRRSYLVVCPNYARPSLRLEDSLPLVAVGVLEPNCCPQHGFVVDRRFTTRRVLRNVADTLDVRGEIA